MRRHMPKKRAQPRDDWDARDRWAHYMTRRLRYEWETGRTSM